MIGTEISFDPLSFAVEFSQTFVPGDLETMFKQAIFVAYMSGVGGNSIVLLYFGNGAICGVDIAAMKFEGTYEEAFDESLSCSVSYTLPANEPLITGNAIESPQQVTLKLDLPSGFWKKSFIEVQTPTGSINVRFEKVRDIA